MQPAGTGRARPRGPRPPSTDRRPRRPNGPPPDGKKTIGCVARASAVVIRRAVCALHDRDRWMIGEGGAAAECSAVQCRDDCAQRLWIVVGPPEERRSLQLPVSPFSPASLARLHCTACMHAKHADEALHSFGAAGDEIGRATRICSAGKRGLVRPCHAMHVPRLAVEPRPSLASSIDQWPPVRSRRDHACVGK